MQDVIDHWRENYYFTLYEFYWIEVRDEEGHNWSYGSDYEEKEERNLC